MKVEIKNLKTIKNLALGEGVTPAYIYKLIKLDKMQSFEIDGIQFIEINRFPSIPAIIKRR